MFHRYSALANCLKASSPLEALFPQGLKVMKSNGTPKYVYKPVYGVTNRGSASTSHTEKVLYKRWQDIPDSMIPTTSKRDPYNTIYRHPKYIKFRKMQIFYQQDDGIPIYLKGGLKDYVMYYGTLIGLIVGCLACLWEWAKMELRWFQKK